MIAIECLLSVLFWGRGVASSASLTWGQQLKIFLFKNYLERLSPLSSTHLESFTLITASIALSSFPRAATVGPGAGRGVGEGG